MVGYKICHTDSDFKKAYQLTSKYYEWLGLDLNLIELNQDLDNFKKMYKNPDGGFLIAYDENENVIGGVGIREFSNESCEMKRLFVLPDFTGKGIGENLCLKIIDLAKELGFINIKLDTLERLTKANGLFQKLGFVETKPFNKSPEKDILFLELDIS